MAGRQSGFLGGGGGGGGGLTMVWGLGDAPSPGLALRGGGGVGSLAIGLLLDSPGLPTQEFHHFDVPGGYQYSRYQRGGRLSFVVEPLALRDSEMAFLRVARPLLGPSVEAALSFQVQHDV